LHVSWKRLENPQRSHDGLNGRERNGTEIPRFVGIGCVIGKQLDHAVGNDTGGCRRGLSAQEFALRNQPAILVGVQWVSLVRFPLFR